MFLRIDRLEALAADLARDLPGVDHETVFRRGPVALVRLGEIRETQ